MAGVANEQQPHAHKTEQHDYYGVPIWLMKNYLVQLGARETQENVLEGAGWRAELRKAEVRHLGSLRVGGTTVDFSGEPGALTAAVRTASLEDLARRWLKTERGD